MHARLTACLSLIVLLLGSCAAPPATHGPIEPPVRVLLLGDSISIGYTQPVRELLGEDYVVVRPTNAKGGAENCAGTNKGVENIDRWIALEGGDWDVIHYNFGLHDLKRVHPETGKNSTDPNDPYQADPERYRAQLGAITERLEATGARLIFATTTPVPEGVRPYRAPSDPLTYNAVALEVLEGRDVVVNDLFTFANARLGEIQKERDVHFSKEGSAALAEQVAGAIRARAGH
ncbi:MAG: SGNH/GDSL hydrolase family protein [Planctomycetota bacterium]|jgi:acyl-CoA thioesterase-1